MWPKGEKHACFTEDWNCRRNMNRSKFPTENAQENWRRQGPGKDLSQDRSKMDRSRFSRESKNERQTEAYGYSMPHYNPHCQNGVQPGYAPVNMGYNHMPTSTMHGGGSMWQYGMPPPTTMQGSGSMWQFGMPPPTTMHGSSTNKIQDEERARLVAEATAAVKAEEEKAARQKAEADALAKKKLMAERLLQTEKDARLVAEKLRTESAARELAEMKLSEMEQRFKEMEKEHVAEKAERLRLQEEKAALAKQNKDEEKAALAKQKKDEEKAALAKQKKDEEKTALDKKGTEDVELTKMNTVHGTLEEEEFDSVGAHLISRGFKRSNSNNWYFVKQFGHDQMDAREQENDDGTTYNSEAGINQLLKGLEEKFKIQFNSLKIQEGSILDHLDIHFSYDKEGQVNVSITPFTQKLVKRNEQICKRTADIF